MVQTASYHQGTTETRDTTPSSLMNPLPGDRHRDSSPPECFTTPFPPRKAVASEWKNVLFFSSTNFYSQYHPQPLVQSAAPTSGSHHGLVYLQVHGGTFSLFLRCKRRKFFKYTAVSQPPSPQRQVVGLESHTEMGRLVEVAGALAELPATLRLLVAHCGEEGRDGESCNQGRRADLRQR